MMYAAFNTLKLELERLLLLRESITISGQACTHKQKLHELNLKIYSHEKAVRLIVTQHQVEQRAMIKALKDKQFNITIN